MSTPRRRHVTTACLPCRESKVKCDGASPTCSSCRTKGKECWYQAGDDKRKLSIRVAIELLSTRTEQLCKFIHDQGLQPPPMPLHDRESLVRSLDHLKLSHFFSGQIDLEQGLSTNDTGQFMSSQLQIHESAVLGGDIEVPSANLSSSGVLESLQPIGSTRDLAGEYAGIDPTLVPAASQLPSPSGHQVLSSHLGPLTWPSGPRNDAFQPPGLGIDDLDTFLPSNTPNSTIQESHTQQSTHLPAPHEDKSSSNNTEALIDQLSERIGSLQIGPGGQVRYYGPTSNFNLVQMPASDNLTVHRTVRNNGQEYLERLGLDKEVPSDLEEHLTKLYFAWQSPVFQVVKRKMFEEARVKWRENKQDTPYYSEALQNAICALGAAFEPRHHPVFVTFPSSLSDFFANRSKALLEIELDSPCVATVQTMIVLSGHDIGCKRDARGWLYSGMAMRLAFDLALHVDMTPHVANGLLTAEEADVRRDVFWSTYTIDHMWGFYLGRPFRVNMEDVTVLKPSGGPLQDSESTWTPYVSSKLTQGADTRTDYPNSLLRQRVLMAEIMAPLGYALYGSLKIPSKTLQEMNGKTVRELLDWKTNLPPILQVNLDDRETQYLPHIILLHMQYYQNLIHAHRPWMSRTYYQPIPPQGPGSDHARMMCMDSAYAITQLLQIYETHYTFRRMNIQGVGITCSAALLLIFATVTGQHREDENDTRLHLSTCFRALDEFGPSWETARRARDFLTLLQRQWEAQERSTKARRVSPTEASSDLAARKRTRTTVAGQAQDSSIQGPQFEEIFIDPELGLSLDWVLTSDVFQLDSQLEGP